MLASISRGSTVITAGGFFGVVREILDDSYIIELGDGVKARILKSSISVRRDENADLKSTNNKKKKGKKAAEEQTPAAVSAETQEPATEAAPEAEQPAAEPVQAEAAPEPEKKDEA